MVPEGIFLMPLPPYSPELQPAERLWCLVDEALVNKSFDKIEDLEEVLAERCQILSLTMSNRSGGASATHHPKRSLSINTYGSLICSGVREIGKLSVRGIAPKGRKE